MTTYEPNMIISEKEFKVVGTRPVRHDGADKVTGRARYSADSHPTGYLHGKILRSPYPHARIKAIDCLLYTSPSPRDRQKSRMPSSA